MSITNSKESAPDSGQPPPEVQRNLDALYKRHTDRANPVNPVEPEEVSTAPARKKETAENLSPGAGLTPEEERLLRCYRQNSAQITIFVNDVELTLDVVHVDRTETSICCLVRQAGFRCKIPRTEKVQIDLEGVTYNTAFLGSWHPVDWLGVNIAVFPILPTDA